MDKASVPSYVRDQRLIYLMDAYGTAVLRTCCMYLKDLATAEDAAQDTFVKAYKNIDSLIDSPSDMEKPWLMRIAINTCKDYRRSAWFRYVDRRINPEDVNLYNEFDADEDLFLFQAVKALPGKLKEVVLLYYYQDFHVNEIAEVIGITESAVYNRLKRAQKKLRIVLEREVSI